MAQNMGLEAKIKSLEDLEQNLQFHSLKSSLASYNPSTPFLTFRWVWDFLKKSIKIFRAFKMELYLASIQKNKGTFFSSIFLEI